jgi:hypothetical protein
MGEERLRMVNSSTPALRCIADFLDRLPGLPEHVVTVHSGGRYISLMFAAGADEEVRLAAVRRVLQALGGQPSVEGVEYGGTGTLGRYTVEVSTGFD